MPRRNGMQRVGGKRLMHHDQATTGWEIRRRQIRTEMQQVMGNLPDRSHLSAPDVIGLLRIFALKCAFMYLQTDDFAVP
jgi:hypothetical protein